MKKRIIPKGISWLCSVAVAVLMLQPTVLALAAVPDGSVVKSTDGTTLYYVSGGVRYVFPNEKTYRSWYDNFSDVISISPEELASIPLKGNVRYRPGVLMVKVTTDPRVFAVGANGVLHWVTSEDIAKKLYGDDWNQLIDDVPDAFFVNYLVGDDISDDTQFDPSEEEDNAKNVRQNRIAQIRTKLEKRIAKNQTRICNQYERSINRIKKRLHTRGITIDGLGQGFLNQCADIIAARDDEDDDKGGDKKIIICHTPPGNTGAKETIRIGAAVARAHLAHGDTLGRCAGDTGGTTDATAPIITEITAAPTTTSATIGWHTNEPATSVVHFSTQHLASTSSPSIVSNSSLVNNHSIVLPNLTSSTTYYFIVASADQHGNTATSTERSFTTTNPAPNDTTPPVISLLTATPTTTSATITWTTDELANGRVRYATSTLGSASTMGNISEATFTTAHSFTLTGLTPSSTYYYEASSTDQHDNTATSTEHTFMTAS